MQFGLLYEIEVPRPWTETSVSDGFWEALEQVKVAEEVGFSHVFSVEHHFLDQFSVASAPEVWLAAVAQHTSTIRIGHGVRLLPFNYNNPIRAAEMAATLDIMRGPAGFRHRPLGVGARARGLRDRPEPDARAVGRGPAHDPEDVDAGRVLLGLADLQDAAA